ncbi:MAG: hypothetical protein F2817_16850, partial [Actinobacteria bacterium]|nr:hypothetical protein [Actinomycetota bacterium]
MPPPNPLKPIQEALERVLHESGLHDFGRSMSSIDDLTAEVQHVYQRVDDIERVLETIVPILERLTVVFEDIQSDLQPMSELASKIPGSGSRRRRREKEAGRIEERASSGPVVPPPGVSTREALADGDGPGAGAVGGVGTPAGTGTGSPGASAGPSGPRGSQGPSARPGGQGAESSGAPVQGPPAAPSPDTAGGTGG